jgi:hypothetical protein
VRGLGVKDDMGECKKGVYINNSIVTHYGLMCFGGFGQSQCDYLEECARDNGMVFRRGKWRLPTIRELKGREENKNA